MPIVEHPKSNSTNKVLLGIAVGCLGLIVLFGAGTAYVVYKAARMGQRMASTMRGPAAPANATAVRQQFSGIPLYPGAVLDAQTTGESARMMGAVYKEMPFAKAAGAPVFAAYNVSAAPSTVVAWYDANMRAKGWSAGGSSSWSHRGAGGKSDQRQYAKGSDSLLVAVSNSAGGAKSHLLLTYMQTPQGKP